MTLLVHALSIIYRTVYIVLHLNLAILDRDLRSFVIRFDFESYVRFEIRFVLMVRFEIFESSALSIVIRKETIGGG